jgi:4-amino-4-deoxy-L-arabinose transferase-like glycosyltransferase
MPDSRATPAVAIAFAAIALVACGLAASTWSTFGHTWDEPEHIAAGLSLLDHGRYDYDIQHPPLARLALALGPYLAGARSQGKPGPDGRPEGIAILYGSGHYDRFLTLARAGALPFLALLLLVTYLWARTLLAPRAALLAAGFVATTPVVLGHGALAALDVPAAATCLLALLAVRRWLEHGRFRDALWLGLALGIAVATKLSAIPFVGLGGVALAALARWQGTAARRARPLARIGGLALAGLVSAIFLTLVYGAHFVYLTDATQRYSQPLAYLFGYSGWLHDLAYAVGAKVRVPEAFQLIVGGIEALSVHNQIGHPSYLLGHIRNAGWWYFYIVALAVKTPPPLLLLGLPGLAVLAHAGIARRSAAALAPPVLFVVLLAFSSYYSRINIGVRHVLVLYPLLAVGAAVTMTRAWAWCQGTRRFAQARAVAALLAVLLGWQLAALAFSWPDYLAYFNGLAPEPRAVLIDSDLDWGQDLKRLAARLAALKVPVISLAYLGTADLPREHLPPYVLLQPDERATGWIAVTALARAHAPRRFDWLDAYRPRERVGPSIDLYFVPPRGTPR